MKRGLNIFLILGVATLWGTVIYRLYGNYFAQPVMARHVSDQSKLPLKKRSFLKDTFEIRTIPRDPFSGASYTPGSKMHHNIKHAATPRSPKVLVPLKFPDIQYYGYIKTGNEAPRGILYLDGKRLTLRQGENKDGILATEIYKDSIRVKFRKQTKSFNRVQR